MQPELCGVLSSENLVLIVVHAGFPERVSDKTSDHECDTECEEVDVLTLVWFKFFNLRRHVHWSTVIGPVEAVLHSSSEGDSVPEIDQFDFEVLSENDILRLNISVCNSCGVQLVQSLTDFDEDVSDEDFILPLTPVQELDELDTLAILHN